MLSKVLTLAQNKVALAALGVLLVGGTGATAAILASQGHPGGTSQAQAGNNSKAGDHPKGSRGHVSGMLTACSTGSISVTDSKGVAYTFAIASSTRFIGNIHGNDSGSSTGASNSTSAIRELCKQVNKVHVQVRATASTSGKNTILTATRVTVGDSSTADTGDHGDDQGD